MRALEITFWISACYAAYAVIGYPLCCFVLARLLPKPVRRAPFEGRVTVLVAVHNEAARLGPKLASLLAGRNGRCVAEVIVGSDGSSDQPAAAIGPLADDRIRLVEFDKRRGKPSVLNDLMKLATGDVVVLTDARQLLAPEAMDALLAPFADDSVGVVSGHLIIRNESGSEGVPGVAKYWSLEKHVRSWEGQWSSVPGATGALYAIRRSLLHPIHPATILDDVAIPMQAVVAGGRCIFENGAICYDRPSASLTQESVRKRRTIGGAIQLLELYPEWLYPWRNPIWFNYISHKVSRLFLPVAVVLCFTMSLLLATQLVYGCIAALYLLLLIGAWIDTIIEQRGIKVLWLSIPRVAAGFIWMTILAWADAIRGNLRVAWDRSEGPK